MYIHDSMYLLYLYGIFLILCGIVSVAFIGMKAKTALASGGLSGIISMLIAFFMGGGNPLFYLAGIFISFALFCVFAWRSTKTLQAIFKLIPVQHEDLNGKAIAFLIISLMAIVSIVTTLLQILNLVRYQFMAD